MAGDGPLRRRGAGAQAEARTALLITVRPTIAKANGADLDTIRRICGHPTLAITERYFGPDPRPQQRSIAGIAHALEAAQG